ncbi:hypothetical protein STEG23_004661, partial [Scotinomys teguina]
NCVPEDQNAAEDEGVLELPATAYRAATLPATTEKLLGKWYITHWAGNLPFPAKKKSSPLPPFTFVINAIGKLEFRMKIMKPIGCVLFKQYLDDFPEYPGFFKVWSKHYIGIFFLKTEDFAMAYYKDNSKHPTYIMTMLMGIINFTIHTIAENHQKWETSYVYSTYEIPYMPARTSSTRKPTGCIEFKISLDEDRNKPSNFYIWPKHKIIIEFLGGENFAIAVHVSSTNNLTLTMTMLMGRSMAPKRTMLLDFEDTVEDLGLNKTDIIHPKCDECCVPKPDRGMWHYVGIMFIGGKNFALAFLNGKTNDVRQKMGMLMGRRNHTANSALLMDFEALVIQLSLNTSSIINPPYDVLTLPSVEQSSYRKYDRDVDTDD